MRLISADGRWWWNGREWQPLPKAVEAEASAGSAAVASEAAPSERPEGPPPTDANGAPRFMPGQYVKSRAEVPGSGMSRRLYDLSGGRINLGPSAAELRHLRLLNMARTPLVDPPVHLAVASAKGGVRVPTHHDRSIKDLIDYLDSPEFDRDQDLTLPMLHRFTTHVPESRLEVVTAPTDPRIRNALSANDYRRVFSVLERYFDIIILDLGTGLLDDTTKFILERVCDQLVVVAPAELDGAELGAFTLEFVADSRGVDWVRERAVVVINRVVKDTQVDVAGMEGYFRQWVRACLRVSQDAHLKSGGIFDWRLISRVADEEILAVTGEVATGFSLGRSVLGAAEPA